MKARVELFVISIFTDAELLNCFGVIRISASYVLTSRTQLELIYYAFVVGFFFFFLLSFFFFLVGVFLFFFFDWLGGVFLVCGTFLELFGVCDLFYLYDYDV